MKLTYPLTFTPAEEGGYVVEGVAPLDNIITEGDTYEEALENAREALSGALASMLEHNIPIPRPQTIPEGVARKKGEVQTVWVAPDPEIISPILVRWAREDAKLTQGELAQRLGTTYQAIQKLERPGSNPTVKTLNKVAKALGKELEIAL